MNEEKFLTTMTNVEEEQNFFVTKRALVELPDSLRSYDKNFSGIYLDDTLLEKKHSELEDVQIQLERCREEFKRKEEGWMEREEILKRKKLEFINYINEKEETTRQTVRKIEKYKKKLEEEKEANILKDKQIGDLKRKIIEHEQLKKVREKDLQKILAYENYLKQLLREEPSFQNMIQILKRYDTLSAALNDLEKELDDNNNNLSKLTKELKTYRKKSQNKIYELNHQIRRAQSKLEKKKSDIKMAEQTHMSKESNLIESTQLLSRVNMSITNLYQKCLETDWLHKSSSVAGSYSKNRKVQVELVKRRMSILMEMYNKMRDQRNKIRMMKRKKRMNNKWSLGKKVAKTKKKKTKKRNTRKSDNKENSNLEPL